MSEAQSLALAAWEISGQHQSRISIPKRFTGPMREMIALQPRFEVMHGRKGISLLEHRRFRAAYDFMVLRSEVGEVDTATAKFWTDVQEQSAEQRLQSFKIDAEGAAKKKRRRPRRRRARTSSPS